MPDAATLNADLRSVIVQREKSHPSTQHEYAARLIVDGKSTWFTGVQLLAMYMIMAVTVFAIPG